MRTIPTGFNFFSQINIQQFFTYSCEIIEIIQNFSGEGTAAP